MKYHTAVAIGIVLCLIGQPETCEAQATFELNGEAHELGEVSAFRIRDRSNPLKYQTIVFLTRSAPDREAIAAARDPLTAAINDPAAEEGSISLSVSVDGTIGMNAFIDGEQYVDTTGLLFGEPGGLHGECSLNSESRVACAIKTLDPVRTQSGGTWTVRADFDVQLLKPSGRPVEAGGGEPGKALVALQAAMAGDDLGAILAHMSQDQAATYKDKASWQSPEEALAAVKEDLARMLPQELQIVDGSYRGEHEAVLWVLGVIAEVHEPVVYSVTMIRQEGGWGYDGSLFVGLADP